MGNSYIGIASLCALLLAWSAPLGAQNTCHPADSQSQHFIRVIKAMMTPEHAPLRTHFRLPLVPPERITIETDPAVCARAGQAIDSLGRSWVPNAPVLPRSTIPLYVVRVGTSYVVIDLISQNDNDGEFFFYFGPSWNHTGIGVSQ